MSALCFIAACGPPDDVDSDVAVPGLDPRIALLGATELDHDDGARLRFSSAGIALRFTGRVRIVIDDDGTSADGGADEDGGNRFVVRVDDRDVDVPRGLRRDLVIGSARADGKGTAAPSTLTLVKRTEALFGAARVVAVVVEEGALLPAPPTLPTLLVLGDSWATGFGVLGDLPAPMPTTATSANTTTTTTTTTTTRVPGPHCPFTPDTQDVTRAWPLLVGNDLGRDVAVVAWSGRGLLRDYDGDERPLSVPEIFATATLANPVGDVVIALGHNDAWSGLPDEQRFRAAHGALLADLRALGAGGTRGTVVVIAPLFDDPPPMAPRTGPLRAWLAAPQPATRDRDIIAGDVVVIDEPAIDETLGFGCVWHPGTRRQRDLALKKRAPLQQALADRTPRP